MKSTASLTPLLLGLVCSLTACASPEQGPQDPNTPTPNDAKLRGRANPPALGAQIDRAGRAAISTALIGTFLDDPGAKGALKDQYNAASTAQWSTFEDEMATSLAILDGLDGVCGNQLIANDDDPAGRYAGLAKVLADDRLYVRSTSGACPAYLGLEAEIVGAIDPNSGGCGGRTLQVDVIDRSYSVLAAGALDGVGDTIDSDDATHSDTFPFLAAPR